MTIRRIITDYHRWERTVSKCRYCGKSMNWLYPNEPVPYVLQWGHVSLQDARNCARPDGTWPHPDRT